MARMCTEQKVNQQQHKDDSQGHVNRNGSQSYCEYHHSRGHSTEECWSNNGQQRNGASSSNWRQNTDNPNNIPIGILQNAKVDKSSSNSKVTFSGASNSNVSSQEPKENFVLQFMREKSSEWQKKNGFSCGNVTISTNSDSRENSVAKEMPEDRLGNVEQKVEVLTKSVEKLIMQLTNQCDKVKMCDCSTQTDGQEGRTISMDNYVPRSQKQSAQSLWKLCVIIVIEPVT